MKTENWAPEVVGSWRTSLVCQEMPTSPVEKRNLPPPVGETSLPPCVACNVQSTSLHRTHHGNQEERSLQLVRFSGKLCRQETYGCTTSTMTAWLSNDAGLRRELRLLSGAPRFSSSSGQAWPGPMMPPQLSHVSWPRWTELMCLIKPSRLRN